MILSAIRPLAAAEELALELEGERDRLCLVQRLKASDNIYEQAECLQGLVLLLGREGEIPWSGRGPRLRDSARDPFVWKPCWISSGSEPAMAVTGVCCAGSQGYEDGWMQGSKKQLPTCLVRQKQVLVARPTAPIH